MVAARMASRSDTVDADVPKRQKLAKITGLIDPVFIAPTSDRMTLGLQNVQRVQKTGGHTGEASIQ